MSLLVINSHEFNSTQSTPKGNRMVDVLCIIRYALFIVSIFKRNILDSFDCHINK